MSGIFTESGPKRFRKKIKIGIGEQGIGPDVELRVPPALNSDYAVELFDSLPTSRAFVQIDQTGKLYHSTSGGGGGGAPILSRFEYNQVPPARVWTIPNQFGVLPGGVNVYNFNGDEFYPDIRVTTSTVTITNSGLESGVAIITL
jgi:hypothetical protein